nr:Unconventional myosin-VIIb like [Ipomoea batatas]
MKDFGSFSVLAMVIGIGFLCLLYSTQDSAFSSSGTTLTWQGNDVTATIKNRKLKDNGGHVPSLGESDAGKVILEDYQPIDPVPSSKTSIKPGPIQHGCKSEESSNYEELEFCGWDGKSCFLGRVRALNFVLGEAAAEDGGEFRQGGEVQVKVTVGAVGGPHAVRRGHPYAVASSGGDPDVSAFIVASLVAPQRLSGGEALVADGTLVDPTAGGAVSGGGGSS